MPAFDLSRFRDLAFGRPTLPDHPLKDEDAVLKMIADLPVDALSGLAEVTHWALSINADPAFTPGRRSRVLMALDGAARPYWSELAEAFLAPGGKPDEGRDGDAAILRAMLDSATAFANGFGFALESAGKPSGWVEKNLALLALRRARWLARRLTLAHMLHLPAVEDIWEDLHLLYELAEARQVLRKVVHVHAGKPLTSSVKQEYTRLVLLDMGGLETLLARDIELAFRITGRIAANARLEPENIPGAICAIVVHGSSRPIAVRRLPETASQVLYLDAFNCLPRLKAMLERNMDTDLAEPDPMFGPGYTLRERNAMINRLIDLWGPTPPQRRTKRVAFKAVALVRGGFESSVEAVPALEQGNWNEQGGAGPRIQMVLDVAGKASKPEVPGKKLAAASMQLVDASVGGLGLLAPRSEARWARLGMLVAVYVEPGPDWVVGAVRRIGAVGDSIGLGISIFSRKARLVWFRLEATGYASVWEEEKRHDRNFLEHFQRGIVVDADRAPLGPGEMLVAPGIAERGSRLDIPLGQGMQRIRVTAVRETSDDFHRVAFESLGITPHTG
jgi:hypothetical protein